MEHQPPHQDPGAEPRDAGGPGATLGWSREQAPGGQAGSLVLVSVEGLPGPARDAVARAVAALLGKEVGDPAPGCLREEAERWSLLARRTAALRRAAAQGRRLFLSEGSWMDKVPRGAPARDLYRRLAAAGTAGLAQHVAVVVRCSPHEAFEGLADNPQVSLLDLCRLEAWLGAPGADAGLPCPLRRLDVACPPRVADNPVDLARLAAYCAARLRRELPGLL